MKGAIPVEHTFSHTSQQYYRAIMIAIDLQLRVVAEKSGSRSGAFCS